MATEPDGPEFDDLVLDGDVDEMPWERHAREAIEAALEDVSLDEIRGVVYAATADDHRGGTDTEGFETLDELLRRLREIGEEQWYANVPYDEGPVFESSIDDLAEEVADKYGIIDFFETVKPPTDAEEVLGTARDLVLPHAGLVLQVDLSDINDELIAYLAKHPEKMHEMHPRKFEELVADIFRAKGYEVHLTPTTRDGGFDMHAFHRSSIGTFLTLIECKRYAPKRPVTVQVVRGLYGVTEDAGANAGLIVTTSTFTKDARSFQDQNKYRIQLADHTELHTWLKEHKRN